MSLTNPKYSPLLAVLEEALATMSVPGMAASNTGAMRVISSNDSPDRGPAAMEILGDWVPISHVPSPPSNEAHSATRSAALLFAPIAGFASGRVYGSCMSQPPLLNHFSWSLSSTPAPRKAAM